MEKALRYLPVSGTVLAVGTLLVLLIYKGAPLDWSSGMALILIAFFGFAIAAALRFAAGELFAPTQLPATADGDTLLRGRLAPLVIGIGTAGILVVAVATLIGISVGQAEPPEPAVYLGILSTVVPVFATWVGSVIAFYFSNESFRQAAQASGALKADDGDRESITSPTRMIPLAKITGIVLKGPRKHPAESGADLTKAPEGGDVYPDKAEDVPMKDIVWMFSDTVSRVIIFDPQMRAVMVIRKKLVPPELTDGATVQAYLEAAQNKADAVNFKTVPETATVGESRAVMRLFNTADLFVTKTGAETDPVKGWVPDDKLL
jgi:hypothetical protein